MRKHPLVVEAASSVGVSNVRCGRIVQLLLKGIMREVSNGAQVRLGLFGSFVSVELPPQAGGRGAKSRREVRFVPGKRFRDELHL